MTQREQQIVARYKAGEKLSSIAKALGMQETNVSTTATKYLPPRNAAITQAEIATAKALDRQGFTPTQVAEKMGISRNRILYIRKLIKNEKAKR